MAAAPRKKSTALKKIRALLTFYISWQTFCLLACHSFRYHGIQLKCPLVWLRFLCHGSWARWALAFLESQRLLSCGEIEIHTKADPKDCQAPATLSLNWVVGSRLFTFPGCSDNLYISNMPAQSFNCSVWEAELFSIWLLQLTCIVALTCRDPEWSQTNQPIQNNAQSADGGFAQSALRISGHPHSGSSWLQPVEVTQPNHYSRWLQPNLKNGPFLWCSLLGQRCQPQLPT